MKRFVCLLMSLVLLFCAAGCTALTSGTVYNGDGLLRVHYIDVGQGDCAFIQLPDGKTVLIDAGESEYGNSVVKYVRSLGHGRVDYVVATHPHADHIGGLTAVIRSLDIGAVFMPSADANTATYERLLETIADKDLGITTAKAGKSLASGDGYRAQFLAPVGDMYSELNNYSAVVLLTFGKTRFLFMGDAERLSEEEITANVRANVIKVGHHGSDSSSGKGFVARVGADIAVISAGKDNKYGHPHKETVARWENAGAMILRTDRDGTVVITSDSKTVSYGNTEF